MTGKSKQDSHLLATGRRALRADTVPLRTEEIPGRCKIPELEMPLTILTSQTILQRIK